MATAVEVSIGRSFGVTFEDGEDFFSALADVCATQSVRYGFIPAFIGAFHDAKVIGTCQRQDGEMPMLSSTIDLDYVEVMGSGTLAFDEELNKLLPHVHLSVGKRLHGAAGITSHLVEARVQFITEMMLVEVLSPSMTRPVSPDLYGLNLLAFGK